MTEEQLREKITGIIAGDGVYYYEVAEAAKYTVDGMEARQLSQIIELMSLFTHQLELAKIEAKIEELKVLDFDDMYDRRNKVVVTFGEIEDRVAELTKQKDLLTKENK